MVKLLVTVPCKSAVLERFKQEFGDKLDITFANENPQITEEAIKDAEVIIGEPKPELLHNARKLKWMQITWAGADRYTGNFPQGVVLTNASGAFGRVISEYTIGMILSQYKRFPGYYVNQKEKLWKKLKS